ncbi:MAG: hypothetical protein ACM3JQ_01480 [Candidatus Eiseniibacteriota bacterium]
MSLKISNYVSFTEWLHNKPRRGRSSKTYIANTLVNMIIINDLDVDIKDMNQFYVEVLDFLRLNSQNDAFVDLFKTAWEEYKKQSFK